MHHLRKAIPAAEEMTFENETKISFDIESNRVIERLSRRCEMPL